MHPQQKLKADIKRFLEVYYFLPSEAKAQFEAELAANTKKMDEATQKLYKSLLQSAKLGKSVEEAISYLNKTSSTRSKSSLE